MQTTTRIRGWLSFLVALVLLGCSSEEEQTPVAETRVTLVSAVAAVAREIEVVEEATGYIEAKTVPDVAAEVAGRIVAVNVDVGQTVKVGDALAQIDDSDYRNVQRSRRGEANRLGILIQNQQRLVKRYRSLEQDDFVSETLMDEAESNLRVLTEQLATTKAQLDIAEHDLEKSTIRSPVNGEIQQRLISRGTFVRRGQTLFQIAAKDQLQAHLPFPETIANRLRPGLKVRLVSPTAKATEVVAEISEVRPMVGASNRSLELIADFDNPGGWRGGSSVDGRVVLETRQGVLVPDLSVVLRPAGLVVYVVEDGVAHQRIVETGEHIEDLIEIRDGVEAGETVAADGAYYLTDGTPVRIETELGD